MTQEFQNEPIFRTKVGGEIRRENSLLVGGHSGAPMVETRPAKARDRTGAAQTDDSHRNHGRRPPDQSPSSTARPLVSDATTASAQPRDLPDPGRTHRKALLSDRLRALRSRDGLWRPSGG